MPRLLLTSLASLALLPAIAHAQGAAPNYPAKPVRWIVPFAPAGPTDLMSRAVAEKLSQRLGQPFVIDNRPGAGGNIGAEVVAHSAPDGYTLMIGHVGTHAINASLYPKLAFDPIRDFTPLSLIATATLALFVHPSVPAKDVRELIALAKTKPGQLNFASAGNGGPTHLTGELLKSMAGISIVHVPYKGNAAALTDLVAGRVQMMFSNMLTGMPHARAGKLRAIAVSSATRSAQAAHLPTVAESGVPGFSSVPWYGALGPAGLPQPIVNRLHAEIADAVAQPDMRERLLAGLDLQSSTPAEFAALIKSELVKWRKVVREAGAKVD